MTESLVNNKWGRMWMSHSHFKMLSCHMPRGTAKKSQKSLCKIGGFLAEI